jgi:hypothetical protein
MVASVVSEIVAAASELLTNLTTVFDDVVNILFDVADGWTPTSLGLIILATAGFALAYSGIRFIFGFINKLLSRTRGGSR